MASMEQCYMLTVALFLDKYDCVTKKAHELKFWTFEKVVTRETNALYI